MDHIYSGVLFSERRPEKVRELKLVPVLLDDKRAGGSQLKSLDDVKDELVTPSSGR